MWTANKAGLLLTAVIALTAPTQLWGQHNHQPEVTESQAMPQHMQLHQKHMQQHQDVVRRLSQLLDRVHTLSQQAANWTNGDDAMDTPFDRRMLQQMGLGLEALTAQMLAWAEHFDGAMHNAVMQEDRAMEMSELHNTGEGFRHHMETMVHHLEGAVGAMADMCQTVDAIDPTP